MEGAQHVRAWLWALISGLPTGATLWQMFSGCCARRYEEALDVLFSGSAG